MKKKFRFWCPFQCEMFVCLVSLGPFIKIITYKNQKNFSFAHLFFRFIFFFQRNGMDVQNKKNGQKRNQKNGNKTKTNPESNWKILFFLLYFSLFYFLSTIIIIIEIFPFNSDSFHNWFRLFTHTMMLFLLLLLLEKKKSIIDSVSQRGEEGCEWIMVFSIFVVSFFPSFFLVVNSRYRFFFLFPVKKNKRITKLENKKN